VITEKKPDFSGEWVLDRTACTLSSGADGVQTSEWRIEHREPSFRLKATAASAAGPVNYEFELSTQQEGSGLRWDGDALVASFQVPTPDGELKISFRYELLDGGRRLRAVEVLRGPGRQQDNTWIFDRRWTKAFDPISSILFACSRAKDPRPPSTDGDI